MKTYSVIGSETQVAATETKSSLSRARAIFKKTTFTNGYPALVVTTVKTKRDANLWLQRSHSALAFASGRLGRWMTPTFVIVAN